jgi:hypothetical protein
VLGDQGEDAGRGDVVCFWVGLDFDQRCGRGEAVPLDLGGDGILR